MAEAASTPNGRPVVLLVDDEPMLLEAIGWELNETCEVHTATSAPEAELRVGERRFDAIVCDHMLEGEQGLDFLIRMNVKFPTTRRILMTGYTNPEFISRSVAIGELSHCLVKPIKTSEIAAAIRSSLVS